jgi:hypothetical protein
MIPGAPPPNTLAPSIAFRLRKGWNYDASAREFIGPKGRRVAAEGLPEGSRIEFKVPSLRAKAANELTKPERALSAAMHAILPSGAQAERHIETVKSWAAVEDVSLPPRISLPKK